MDTFFSVTYVVFAVLAVGISLIAVFCYYSYKFKEKNLPSEESTDSKESQEPEAEFEEDGSSEDSTDSEDDEAFREKVSRDMENFFRDLVFDRILARIVDQVDGLTFQARFCETNLIVRCYLRPELYSNLTRPLVGGLVRLEYNYSFGPRVYYIIQLIDSNSTNSKIKEGPPWRWNTLFAEIIGEYQYEEEDERILYASLDSLEPGQVVLCKVCDYLRETIIQDGDIVYLEVNETDRSFYKIVEIVERCDS